MSDRFTEHDAVRLSREIRDNILGEPVPDDEALFVCPIMTAGLMANPNYRHGGVECLEHRCEFYIGTTVRDGECAIHRMSVHIEDIAKFLERKNKR